MTASPKDRSDGKESRVLRREFSLDLVDVFTEDEEGAVVSKREDSKRSASLSPRKTMATTPQRTKQAPSRNHSKGKKQTKTSPKKQHQSTTDLTPGLLLSYLSNNNSIASAPPTVSTETNSSSLSRDGGEAEDEATIGSKEKLRRKVEREKRKQQSKTKHKTTKQPKSPLKEQKSSKSSKKQKRRTKGSKKPNKPDLSLHESCNDSSKREMASCYESSSHQSQSSFSLNNSDLLNASFANRSIDFVASDGEKEEDAALQDAAMLQFDPSASDNVFAVKQVHTSESECEVNNTDGSQSIVSIKEMEDDPMSQAQRHQSSSTKPIFDFLDASVSSNRSRRSESRSKPKRKKQTSSSQMVDDAQNYAQFFASDKSDKSSSTTRGDSGASTISKGKTAPVPPATPPVVSALHDSKSSTRSAKTINTKDQDKDKKKGATTSPRKEKKKSVGEGSSAQRSASPKKAVKKTKSSSSSRSKGHNKQRESDDRSEKAGSSPKRKQHRTRPQENLEEFLVAPRPKANDASSLQDNSSKVSSLQDSNVNPPSGEFYEEDEVSLYEPPTNTDATKQTKGQRDQDPSESMDDSSVWDSETEERTLSPQQRKSKNRGGLGLATSIGRYFGRVKRNATGTDVEASDNDDDAGSVVSTASGRGRFARRRKNRGHEMLGDDSSS